MLEENSTLVTQGLDGTKIKTVPTEIWKKFILDAKQQGTANEWYLNDSMMWMKEHLNVGYFPQGVAISQSKTIYVVKGAEKDESLLIHEYGHILGYGHTAPASSDIMNPVDSLRVTDHRGISSRFESNFGEYYHKVLVPSERKRAIPGLVAAGLVLYGWLS